MKTGTLCSTMLVALMAACSASAQAVDFSTTPQVFEQIEFPTGSTTVSAMPYQISLQAPSLITLQVGITNFDQSFEISGWLDGIRLTPPNDVDGNQTNATFIEPLDAGVHTFQAGFLMAGLPKPYTFTSTARYDFSAAAVPEPATNGLLLLGLFTLVARYRRTATCRA